MGGLRDFLNFLSHTLFSLFQYSQHVELVRSGNVFFSFMELNDEIIIRMVSDYFANGDLLRLKRKMYDSTVFKNGHVLSFRNRIFKIFKNIAVVGRGGAEGFLLYLLWMLQSGVCERRNPTKIW